MKCRILVIQFLIALLELGPRTTPAQSLTLVPTLSGHTLQPNAKYYSHLHKDTIQIDKLKFYISNVSLDNAAGKKVQLGDHYLFDIEKAESLILTNESNDENKKAAELGEENEDQSIYLTKAKAKSKAEREAEVYSHLRFCIGVDSLINESGAQGGVLDPMHGMYWAWNSGYINFKIEGCSSLCPTRKQKFQLHVGGFMAPYDALRQVSIPAPLDGDTIIFPIDDFLDGIDLKTQHTIMSPSEASMYIADLFPNSFKLKE